MMEHLPEAIIQSILSNLNNARDVASCNCVSKEWKNSTPYITALYFPRNSFDKRSPTGETPDNIIERMVSRVMHLEELIVFCPFSRFGLASWLSVVGLSLRRLELRLDDPAGDCRPSAEHRPSKLDFIGAARNLESLKLWSVDIVDPPYWNVFQNLKNLEIIGATLEDSVLARMLLSCPFLTRLSLITCYGVNTVSIKLPHLERCKLHFCGSGKCVLSLNSPKIESLEVIGCSRIKVPQTKHLRNLAIYNSAGRVDTVAIESLAALEFLSMRGCQWRWDAIRKMLRLASEVKHLDMKVEFTGNHEDLQSFPKIDLVEFFNSHQKLQKFDIHGAMFAALCHKNSRKQVDSEFLIPCLEEVVITVRSPLNAEQKLSTLESLLKYGKSLRSMVIKILGMKSSCDTLDDFFHEICRFKNMNRNIVTIQ